MLYLDDDEDIGCLESWSDEALIQEYCTSGLFMDYHPDDFEEDLKNLED